MSTPSIKVGQGNWGIKAGNLLGYANTEKKFSPVEFTSSRALDTATRVNASGNIQIVNANVPRIDYFGGQASLLVEPSAVNGILNSSDLTNANWTLGGNLTSGAIDVIGALGNNITIASGGSGIGSAAGRFVRFNNNVALASGSTYTVSFLMKKTGSHTIGGYQLLMSSGVIGSGFDVSGSFSSGANVDTAPTTNRVRRIEQWGTDVYRCSETFTMTAAATGTHLAFGPVSTIFVSTNSAVGTTIGFAAPQLELSSVPTSFIPTTTGTVTRNADVISVTGVAGLIGQTEGTIYAEVDLSRITTNAILSLNDGTGTNRFIIQFFSSTVLLADIRVAGVNANYSVTIPAIPANGGIYKVALGYKANDYCFALNGTTYASTASRGVPATTQINLGNYLSSNQFNDRIRAVSIYQTRLPNTTTDGSLSLQSITTL